MMGWVSLLIAAAAVVWVAFEIAAARRAFRPARIGVVFSAAVILTGSAIVGLLSGLDLGGLVGMPRRYAEYDPEPGFQPLILLPALGVGLLGGAFIGAVRVSSAPADAIPAARTRNRMFAAVGAVLVVVGVAAIAVR